MLPAGYTSAMLDLLIIMRKTAGNTSPYTGANGFHSIDYIKITILGFGLSALWASFHTVILQVRLLDFVAESLKNTYLGYLTFAGALIAMATQPIAGAISDRSGFTWGRRRPFILPGIILALLFLPGIGLGSSYLAIFIIYCLMQISTNTAQGPFQGFIPDLVPQGKRGVASGVRSLLNIVGGAVLIGVIGRFMGYYSAGEGSSWLWLSLGTLAIVLLGTMLVTVLTVKERPGIGGSRFPLLLTLYKSFKVDVRARPNFILFLVACLFIFMPWTALETFALYFLKDVIGIANPAAVTADLIIVVTACMLATVYPAGRLSDRVGRKLVIVPACLLSALGVVALFFSRSYMHILLCGGLLGISSGAWMSSQWALATDLVGKGEEARYLGLVNLVIAGGGALARLIGPVIDFFNAHSPNLGYSVMFLFCFVCFVIGSLLLLKIKRA
jgi:Na+/melibiose symporter-like transporter